MSDRSRSGYPLALAVSILLAGAAVVAVFSLRPAGKGPQAVRKLLPQPGSDTYQRMVSAFFAGVAALDVDANERAKTALACATELVPQEPAGWADRGLLNLRLGDFDGAARDLEKARGLAPESGAVERLLGLLESRRGQFAEAIAHLRRAVELAPSDLKARFALVKELERQAGPDSDALSLRMAGEIAALQPDNVVVLLEWARLAVKRGDAQALNDSVARLGQLASSWPTKAQEVYRELEQTAKANPRSAVRPVLTVRNLLVQTPAFRQSLAAVETPVGTVGEPIETFLRLPPPPPTPSPPDDALSFAIRAGGRGRDVALGQPCWLCR